MTDMFTYNMIVCITSNTTGLTEKFWKLFTPRLYFDEELPIAVNDITIR
jgi:hypothetical protein